MANARVLLQVTVSGKGNTLWYEDGDTTVAYLGRLIAIQCA